MHSRPARRGVFLAVLLAALMGGLIEPQIALSAEPGAAPRLESYTDPATGQAYFALLLSHPAANAQPGPIDLALIVDLSASQSGKACEATLRTATKTVDELVGGSRAQIWLTNRSEPLLSRPAAVARRASSSRAGSFMSQWASLRSKSRWGPPSR